MPDPTPSHQSPKYGAVSQLATSHDLTLRSRSAAADRTRPGPFWGAGSLSWGAGRVSGLGILGLPHRGHDYLMSWIAIDVEPRTIGWPGTIGPDDT
jgi:hypothetical protein